MTNLQERAENAHNRYKAESAKLLREDGTRRFSDSEHHEREAELKRERDAALDGIETEADEQISRAEATLARYVDRSALLSTEELTAANARRPFVSEDADSLPLSELAERLEAIAEASGGEKVSAFLYARYARARAERERASDDRVQFTDSYRRLEAALGTLDEKLTTQEERAAMRTIEEAADAAECHPASIRRWLKDEKFSRAYWQARREALDGAIAALQGSATRAAHTLEDELDNDSSGIRIRAAISILDRAIKGQELFDVIERLEALEEVMEAKKESRQWG
jgi:hypothetical protein